MGLLHNRALHPILTSIVPSPGSKICKTSARPKVDYDMLKLC